MGESMKLSCQATATRGRCLAWIEIKRRPVGSASTPFVASTAAPRAPSLQPRRQYPAAGLLGCRLGRRPSTGYESPKSLHPLHRRKPMIRLIAVAAIALAAATSAQAMSPAPLHQADGMITQVREACGAGRVRINGICVARTTVRQTRRCARWNGGVCVRWF